MKILIYKQSNKNKNNKEVRTKIKDHLYNFILQFRIIDAFHEHSLSTSCWPSAKAVELWERKKTKDMVPALAPVCGLISKLICVLYNEST